MELLPLDALLAIGQYLPSLAFLRRICRSLAENEDLADEIGRKINWTKVIDVVDNAAKIRQNNPAILRYYHHFPFHYYLRRRCVWNLEVLKKYAPMWNWSELPYLEKFHTELLRIYEPLLTEAQWEEFTREVPLTGQQVIEYAERIDWDLFCRVRPVNDVLINLYPERINWELLSRNEKTCYYIMEQYSEKMNWREVGKWADREMLDKKYRDLLEK
ncbi:hypothetical protein BNJ_00019 [Kaumoebavirus]|uniref:hypothetical protein n=1 Tax=Kaumoebavirus TaxID=1859492 RepID=UPI0009C3586E|nr:hypothetical protein BNJ_00019 [Kaumoebavirus]ARA71863.1 hypothetical protein BNJ_00019 [Kaumoebavirus]